LPSQPRSLTQSERRDDRTRRRLRCTPRSADRSCTLREPGIHCCVANGSDRGGSVGVPISRLSRVRHQTASPRIAAFNELIKDGTVAEWAISNYSADETELVVRTGTGDGTATAGGQPGQLQPGRPQRGRGRLVAASGGPDSPARSMGGRLELERCRIRVARPGFHHSHSGEFAPRCTAPSRKTCPRPTAG
jgi:hypothetical protein